MGKKKSEENTGKPFEREKAKYNNKEKKNHMHAF